MRSGGVELFLAGAVRQVDEGGEFAVHAWADEDGRQADDYAADAPENAKYLAYYMEMGMDARTAGAFYAMTNSVPYEQARWIGAAEMRRWIMPQTRTSGLGEGVVGTPRLAYLGVDDLDLGRALP